jgi:hypothetical protein
MRIYKNLSEILFDFAIFFRGVERKNWYGEFIDLEKQHIASDIKNGQ